MDSPPEHLNSGPVELRHWRAADAELCLRLVGESLDHLRPWMPWATSGYDLAAAEDFVQRCEADWAAGTAFNYLILSGGEPAGGAGLHARIDPADAADLCDMLARDISAWQLDAGPADSA